MRTVTYELTNGKSTIITRDYTRAKELAASGYEMRTYLTKKSEPRSPLSPKRQSMIEQYGRVTKKYAEMV